MSIQKCKFFSNWDDDIIIETNASYNSETGEIVSDLYENGNNLNILNSQWIEVDDCEIPVCMFCGQFITKARMIDNNGTDLFEVHECVDPDCRADNY